ncbi:MAG: thioredoxin domain-containing protein, partial [Bacteroidota bacterium]
DQVELNETLLDAALNSLAREHDVRYGGFGGAPKFPHPSAIELLLLRYHETREQWMIDAVAKTLRAMAKGGIYDQLGGGFHRYSTDEKWIVPHFEKMLYDNAPLLKNYVHSYQATGDEFFKETTLDIIRNVLEVLTDSERGGFYASQDADVSFGDDGSYFTWTLEAARKVLSSDELEVMKLRYNIYERGEMHHDAAQNVLFIDNEPEQIAALLHKPADEIQTLLPRGKEKMRQARMRRKAPFVDRTIYASWNGMMISALLHAYRAFGIAEHRSIALKSIERILAEHRSEQGLVTHRASVIAQEAFLDDQVEITQALLDAYEATGTETYLTEAERLMVNTVEFFWDKNSVGFTDIPSGQLSLGALRTKNKPIQDSPTAGGNAVAVIALLRLHTLTEKSEFREYAEQILRLFAGSMKNSGIFAATYFIGLDMFLNPPPNIVVVSNAGDPLGEALYRQALSTYRPSATVSLVHPESARSLPPSVQSMSRAYSRALAYVCSNFVCSPPISDVASLERTLKSLDRKAGVAQ